MWARHASPLRIGGLENPPSFIHLRSSSKSAVHLLLPFVLFALFRGYSTLSPSLSRRRPSAKADVLWALCGYSPLPFVSLVLILVS